LIATVLLVIYLAALVIYQVPYGWLIAIAIIIALLCRKTYRYTSHGTAFWATPEHLEGMIDE
jgi:hypothetical protein